MSGFIKSEGLNSVNDSKDGKNAKCNLTKKRQQTADFFEAAD
jgi:hypothetical protein